MDDESIISSLHCQICNKSFTGIEPARQHCASSKHIKQSGVWNVSGRKWTEPTLADYLVPDQTSADGEKNGDQNSRGDFKFCDASNRGTCYVCQIDLTSAEHARQHLSGKSHKKKSDQHKLMQQMNTNGGASIPVLTDQPLSDLASTESNSYQEKVMNGQVWYKCIPCDKLLNTLDMLHIHQRSPKHAKCANKLSLMPSSRSVLSTDGSGDSCDSSLTTEATEQYDIASDRVIIGGQICYRCHDCKCNLNTQEQLDTHRRSPKHLKTVQGLKYAVENLGSIGPGADRTIWYSCDICGKKLNSPAQLNTHKISHGLLAASAGGGTLQSDISDIDFVPARSSLQSFKTDQDQTAASSTGPAPQVESQVSSHNTIASSPTVRNNESSDGEGFCSAESSPVHSPSIMYADSKLPMLTEKISKLVTDDVDVTKEPSRNTSVTSSPTLDSFNTTVGSSSLVTDSSLSTRCEFDACFWHCNVCNKHLGGPEPKRDHVQSIKHLRKIQLAGIGSRLVTDDLIPLANVERSENTPEGYFSYCDVCKVPFTGPESYASHMRGKLHKSKAAKTVIAPERNVEPVNKYTVADWTDVRVLTEKKPRMYQIELYTKAMKADSVIFLPTGTGKTLVGVMVISKMLKMNPSRQVLFLVDRNLLVIQQSGVIRKELANQQFNRFDHSTQQYVNREIRVASLCSELQDSDETGGVPLWQHDVLVATAGYYLNLLQQRCLHWSHNCLVVFDEAHHCMKNHPFNEILRSYHLEMEAPNRPQTLGLTASPAGQMSVQATQDMLNVLLDNMGGVQVRMVEEEEAELKKYQSSAEIAIHQLQTHPGEKRLHSALLENMDWCCDLLLKQPNVQAHDKLYKVFKNIKAYLELYSDPGNGDTELADKIDGFHDDIKDLKEDVEVLGAPIINLYMHLNDVMSVYFDLDSIGYDVAIITLQRAHDTTEKFKEVQSMGISCEQLRRVVHDQVNHYSKMDLDSTTKKHALVNMLIDMIDWEDGKRNEKTEWPMVLVLVRKRDYALNLSEWLKEHKAIQDLGLRISRLVGHGTGKGDGGQSVKQQEKILSNIREHEYDVIVATSVAEEGLDIPECELVVQMDPPKTVTALVQVRGRARKRGSRYMMICRTPEQAEEISEFMEREEHMIEAVKQTIAKQNQRRHFTM